MPGVSDRTGTVLVTGGAGFIGSELVAQLAAEGRRVIVLDNLSTGRLENLSGLEAERVCFVPGDVRDRGLLKELLPQASVVFCLACLGVRHSLVAPRETHDVNATATLELLQAAREAGVGRFVYVSSSEVYGIAQRVPIAEDHPTLPVNAYGASKLCGEAYTRAFFLTYRFPTVVVRPFNTYGPRCHHEGLSGEVIPKFLLRALAGKELVVFGDGLQTRDFIHVSDTARGIVLAGTVNDAVGETLNLGTGRETTILDLGRLVGEVAGRAVVELRHDEPRPGNTPRLCADPARARERLGFIPRVSLEEGLEALRDWYLGQAESPHQLLAAEVVRCWEEASVHAAHE